MNFFSSNCHHENSPLMLRFILLWDTDFCLWQFPVFCPTSPSYLSKSKFFSLLFFCVHLHQSQFLEESATSVGSTRGINWGDVRNGVSQLLQQRLKSSWQGFPRYISSSSGSGAQVDCGDILYWYKIGEWHLACPGVVLLPHAELTGVTRVCELFSATTHSSQDCVWMCRRAEDVQEALRLPRTCCPGARTFVGNPASVHIPFPLSPNTHRIYCTNTGHVLY